MPNSVHDARNESPAPMINCHLIDRINIWNVCLKLVKPTFVLNACVSLNELDEGMSERNFAISSIYIQSQAY